MVLPCPSSRTSYRVERRILQTHHLRLGLGYGGRPSSSVCEGGQHMADRIPGLYGSQQAIDFGCVHV